MEKSRPHSTVQELNSDDDLKSGSETKPVNWQPGYLKRFPTAGALAILIVLLTAVGCAAVLYFANGKSSAQWPSSFPPNVAISILNAIANIALGTIVSKGVAIAWWVKATRGATVAQLHQSWKSSSSTLDVVKHITRLNMIGFAVLVAKLSAIDSVLYQRAIDTYVGQDQPRQVSMIGAAATTFPSTGFVVSEGFAAQTQCNCFMIGDAYTPVVNTWETSNGFFQGYNRYFQECDGVCYTHIDAIGFEIDCDMNLNKTDIAIAPIEAFRAAKGQGNDTAWSNIPIFNSSFSMSYADGVTTNQTVINLDLQYFQSYDPWNPSGETCQGTVTTIQCKLRPAVVRYPITIQNFTNPHVTNGVSLGSLANKTSDTNYLVVSNQNIQPYSYTAKQAEGFEVLSYLYPNETGQLNSTTYLGGLANALHISLTSSATITYQGQGAWALAQSGTLSQTMMFGPPNMGSCDCSFRDESLSTIVASINQLAYLTSTGMIDQTAITFPTESTSGISDTFWFPSPKPVLSVNTSTPLQIQGVSENSTTFFVPLEHTIQISDVSFYKTHFLFLGLGVGATLLCLAGILPLYWHYGTLGRQVSLGPIEIAGAFGAPVLATPLSATTRPETTNKPPSPTSTPTTKPQSPTITPPATNRKPIPQPLHITPTSNLQSPTNPTTTSSPPSTTTAVTFANVDDLLASVGHRKVVYGVLDVSHDDHDPSILSISPHGPPGTPMTPGSSGVMSPGGTRKRTSQIVTFGDLEDGRVRPVLSKRGTGASLGGAGASLLSPR